jgi:membrane protease YdiL (CAAX protease family)
MADHPPCGTLTLKRYLAIKDGIMKTIKASVERHPLLSFYALAFAITWGGLIMVVGGPSEILGIPPLLGTRFALVMLAWLAGPSVASILMTGVAYGKVGLRDLLTRMTRWRVGARWYAVAILTAPLLVTAILFALSLSSPEYLPTILTTSDKVSLLLLGIVGTLVGGIFEELGWTGFATPTLLRRMRHGVLTTGLIVGVLWGVAHFPLYYWGASGHLSGALLVAVVAANILAWFPAYRVLMVWVYDRTESLLLAMLMHGSATGSLVIFASLAPGWRLFTFLLVFGAVLWVVVGAVALANDGHLTRVPRQPPLRRRVA